MKILNREIRERHKKILAKVENGIVCELMELLGMVR